MSAHKVQGLPGKIIQALESSIGPGPAQLHEPDFEGNEWPFLKDCLDSTFVSSVGKYVDQFEQDLASFTGASHAVAVVNGTAALHVALLLSGVTEGDEVLVPALTFVATANAVTYCNAHPHFIDSEMATLGIDPVRLREYLSAETEFREEECFNASTGRRISALIVMHTFGHPANLDELRQVSREFNLALVEDAAESLGSFYQDRHTGTIGDVGILSFNGNKIVTTGGGGALLLNDSKIAERAKHLTTTAKISHPWEYRHDQIGFNYRLPNLNAALGCAQMESLASKVAKKRALYERYQEHFGDIDEVKLFKEPEGCNSNYWLQALVLEDPSERNEVLEKTNAAGYATRPVWALMNDLPPYKDNPCMKLETASFLSERIINIPSSSFL